MLTITGRRHSRVRRLALTGFVVGLLIAGMGAPAAASPVNAAPVKATASVAALCAATIPLNISPGLRILQPTSGTNQSYGETGTLSCLGTLDGFPIAGTGTIGFSGNYSGTCTYASGTGTWSFSVPVNDHGVIRVIHHSGTYSAPNVGLAIVFDGLFQTGRLSGAGVVVLQQGNCALQPANEGLAADGRRVSDSVVRLKYPTAVHAP